LAANPVTFSKIPNGKPIGLCNGWHPNQNDMRCVKAEDYSCSDETQGPFCLFHVRAYQANALHLIETQVVAEKAEEVTITNDDTSDSAAASS